MRYIHTPGHVPAPKRDPVAADASGHPGDFFHHPGAQKRMNQVANLKANAQDAGNPAKIFGDPGCPYLSSFIPGIDTSQGLGEFSGVNGHRAGRGAHAVDRTREFALIDVIIFHLPEPGSIFVGGSQPGNFPLDHNALSGRQGKTF